MAAWNPGTLSIVAERRLNSELAPGLPRDFTTTHWSVVLEAGQERDKLA